MILIASALLLNGARNVRADAVPSQVPTPQTSSEAKRPNAETNSKQEHGPTPSGVSNQQSRNTPTPGQDSENQKRESAELALNRSLILYTGQLAVYTFWLVIVGAVASLVALLQAGFSFVSIQGYLRPNVRIRSFHLINDLRSYVEDKALLRFMLVLVNHGGSRAKVKSGNITIRITRTRNIPSFGAGDAATYRPPFNFLKNETIPCGPDSPFECRDERVYTVREIQDVIEEKAFLHVVVF
ncbi:MAG: hypothetical protein ABSD51_10600, partial [Candidatus Binatus sp.]